MNQQTNQIPDHPWDRHSVAVNQVMTETVSKTFEDFNCMNRNIGLAVSKFADTKPSIKEIMINSDLIDSLFKNYSNMTSFFRFVDKRAGDLSMV